MADLATLVAARYGRPAGPVAAAKDVIGEAVGSPPLRRASNDTLGTLLSHKSVRHFVPGQALPEGTLDLLVAAAQSASSSSNLQAWSVVAVQDAERRARLAELSGQQAFVREAPLVLVFVADLHRAAEASAAAAEVDHVAETVEPAATPLAGGPAALPYTELFLVASLDAAFAAQNAFVAAEALGLGACYVGAARNRPRDVAALLGLPSRVVGLFALAIGVPDRSAPAVVAPVKPRLPAAEILHRESWDDRSQRSHFAAYDAALAAFNAQQRADQPVWTKRVQARVGTVAGLHGRHELRDILQERNLALL